MKDQEINKAIAKACGWKEAAESERHLDMGDMGVMILRKLYYGAVTPPFYTTDLNAMHEAEKILKDGQIYAYVVKLSNLCPEETQCALATARQRAEAFLKTLGKWKDD